MNTKKKESYVQPELVTHGLLRDITAGHTGQSNNGENERFFRLRHKED
jgi:hypothetical protein